MNTETIFAGFGGQGILMMGYLTALAGMRQGKNVTFLPSYGAEIRGGTANCTVVVGDEEISSPVSSLPDYLVVMNHPSLMRFGSLVKDNGTVLINSSLIQASTRRPDLCEIRLEANKLANDLGAGRSANMVMLGALAQVSGLVDLDVLKAALKETKLGAKIEILKLNQRALELGAEEARLNQ